MVRGAGKYVVSEAETQVRENDGDFGEDSVPQIGAWNMRQVVLT